MADTPGLHPKGHGMERSSKRGKIPQKDWPSIMVRYEAGETLASIAKTYDCSPPAISYVVSRSRARPAAAVASPAAPVASAAEPQLIKSASVAADSLAGVNGRTAPSLASAILAPPANG